MYQCLSVFREKGEVSELLQVLANKMSLETLEEEEGIIQSTFHVKDIKIFLHLGETTAHNYILKTPI